jgi:hypothetical protein
MFQQKAIFWIAMWHDVFPEFDKRPGETDGPNWLSSFNQSKVGPGMHQ